MYLNRWKQSQKCLQNILWLYETTGGKQRHRPSWPEITSEGTDDRWVGEDGVINWRHWDEKCYNRVSSAEAAAQEWLSSPMRVQKNKDTMIPEPQSDGHRSVFKSRCDRFRMFQQIGKVITSLIRSHWLCSSLSAPEVLLSAWPWPLTSSHRERTSPKK